MSEIRVPRLQGVNGRIIKRSEAIPQDARSAKGKLHDDGAVFHPGERSTVIELADVTEGKRGGYGKKPYYEKAFNFHVGGPLREWEPYSKESL